ncbi:hypothetical protein MYAM1_003758 [Malassezia yamatoensis]|uniref:Uncharacterized protein n=1 Tax=Malassezia yamatoensis TaxID=253288 RepID=A0AAJ5YWD3_9BASI|nr:hypothetical protein MYAM1_003758 [Malassezia yamatoensis]
MSAIFPITYEKHGSDVSFSQSVPVQTMSLGVLLAISMIILAQLLFTAPFHYPLSRSNFVLQVVASLLFLTLVTVSIGYILWDLKRYAMSVPHLFPYVSQAMPPKKHNWSSVQLGFFLLLLSSTVALSHATHIQFLTILYPSTLEVRLIIGLLAPIVLTQFALFYLHLRLHDQFVQTAYNSVQDICESSLSLLYTFALIFWSTLLNRRNAWRTEGSAIVFGIATILVSVGKTITSFVLIRFQRTYWILLISWALTIWQSWLGFWWWVSTGMGISENQDRLKKRKKESRRFSRKASRGESSASASPSSLAADHAEDRNRSFVQQENHNNDHSHQSSSANVPSSRVSLPSKMGLLLERFFPAALRSFQTEHKKAVMQAAQRQTDAIHQVAARPNMLHEQTLLNVQMQGTSRKDEERGTRNAFRRIRLQDRTTYEQEEEEAIEMHTLSS